MTRVERVQRLRAKSPCADVDQAEVLPGAAELRVLVDRDSYAAAASSKLLLLEADVAEREVEDGARAGSPRLFSSIAAASSILSAAISSSIFCSWSRSAR